MPLKGSNGSSFRRCWRLSVALFSAKKLIEAEAAKGVAAGTAEDTVDGTVDFTADGTTDGTADGSLVGTADGSLVGTADGTAFGTADDMADGAAANGADGVRTISTFVTTGWGGNKIAGELMDGSNIGLTWGREFLTVVGCSIRKNPDKGSAGGGFLTST